MLNRDDISLKVNIGKYTVVTSSSIPCQRFYMKIGEIIEGGYFYKSSYRVYFKDSLFTCGLLFIHEIEIFDTYEDAEKFIARLKKAQCLA